MGIDDLLQRLDRVRSRGAGRWSAPCPAHPDRDPSLSIREIDDRILLRCFGGCETEEVVSALGLKMHDLFRNTPSSGGRRPTPRPQKLNLIALAFRVELAALDRRLRADSVLKAATNLKGVELSEPQRDRVTNAILQAYDDRDRAELLEAIADDLKLKAYFERNKPHAA